ncbi:hypothetical protein N9137_02270 [Pseudomonadales bacterium]|nr:hypothetical protein [Pseudomonadales bacterium]
MSKNVDNHKRSWSGEMSTENMDSILNRIKIMLSGKKYTFSSTNAGNPHGYQTYVRVNQSLKKNDFVCWLKKEHGHAFGGFNINDSYGIWGLSCSNLSEKNPHVTFEHESIKIKQYNGYGDILEWHIVVQ